MEQFSKELKHVLKKMCKMVGTKYSSINFKASNWYSLHTWTKEQEDAFVKWLSDYIYKGEGKKLVRLSRPTRKIANKAAYEFILNYGWETTP